jgi:FHA domain-containing protein
VSVLRTIEQKIEALVEGVFGRAFRASVQPVELARKLVKEMDDHKTVSVSRVYVPNEYTVYLSTKDREQFASYEASLRAELQDYLAEHARREGYVLLSVPVVLVTTDDDLQLGEFGIATRMIQRKQEAAPEPPLPAIEPGATMVYRPRDLPETGSPEEPVVEPAMITLTAEGVRHEVRTRRVVIGRAQECDVQLADPNISRQHAELLQEGTSYWIVDLDSTNGLEVNGRRLKRARLEHGDRITIGSTELVFEVGFPDPVGQA